jgi:hypothetical protein
MTLRTSENKVNNSAITTFHFMLTFALLSVVVLIVVMLNVVEPFQAANAIYWIVKTHFEIGRVNDP